MNLSQFTKEEILKRNFFKCVHGHTGIEHPNCFDQANNRKEKIGYLDIESSGLQADFAIVLSYCIKKENGEILKRVLTKKELESGIFDRELLKQCVQDMLKFDRLIYHYGNRFDIPVLRTRCVYWKIYFPLYKEVKGTDTYPILKYKFKLHSNRLESACDFFGIPSKKHRIQPDIWIKALSGDKKSLDWILKHNEEDVVSLEELYKRINPYSNITNSSI